MIRNLWWWRILWMQLKTKLRRKKAWMIQVSTFTQKRWTRSQKRIITVLPTLILQKSLKSIVRRGQICFRPFDQGWVYIWKWIRMLSSALSVYWERYLSVQDVCERGSDHSGYSLYPRQSLSRTKWRVEFEWRSITEKSTSNNQPSNYLICCSSSWKGNNIMQKWIIIGVIINYG